jgi:hypothetical protein
VVGLQRELTGQNEQALLAADLARVDVAEGKDDGAVAGPRFESCRAPLSA